REGHEGTERADRSRWPGLLAARRPEGNAIPVWRRRAAHRGLDLRPGRPSVEVDEPGVQQPVRIVRSLGRAQLRPLLAEVQAPSLLVEVDVAGEVTFAVHRHRQVRSLIEARESDVQVLSGDAWQDAEPHDPLAVRPHEEGDGRGP